LNYEPYAEFCELSDKQKTGTFIFENFPNVTMTRHTVRQKFKSKGASIF